MKNSIRILIFVLILCYQNELSAGGFYVGNGGDIIHCARTRRFGITKPYALDYYLANVTMKNEFSMMPINSLSSSLANIEVMLSEKLPFLLESFQEYSGLIFNTDRTKKYYWVKETNLNNIEDEGYGIFPKNCWDEYNMMGRIDQAIIRQVVSTKESKEKKIRFLYDAALLNSLKINSSLQYSFLIIHEWLRDFTNNPETIRKVNYYLHSKEFTTDNALEVKKRLSRFNFKTPIE
jgi:hypothetical protein